jgi:hypothetical protein
MSKNASLRFRPLRSKLSFKNTVGPDNKDRIHNACHTAVNGLQSILQILSAVTGPSFPGLKVGFDGLLYVIEIAKVIHSSVRFAFPLISEQKMYENTKDMEELAWHITELINIVQRAARNGVLSTAMLARIERASS